MKKEKENAESTSISIGGIFSNLKRFFALWISVTIMFSVISIVVSSIINRDLYRETSAMVSFTYSGIEKGIDPAGNKFDMNIFKSSELINRTLDKLGYNSDEAEEIRNGIIVEGIVPGDAIDRIAAYKSIDESEEDDNQAATEKLLDSTYYPTQFKIRFNYSNVNINGSDAALFLNTMLECYSEYFFEKYGYNAALGESITAIDYKDYDYAEAIDVFDDTLSMLQSYVSNISKTDSSRFRSTETGLTFSDLSKTMSIVRDYDLDMISSYVSMYSVTKDKDILLTYYKHRVENLQRTEVIYREKLESVKESIKEYEKNTVMIFSNGTDGMKTEASEASEQYNHLYDLKTSTQADLSSTIQRINYYNSRIDKLNNATIASADKIEQVEKDLEKLNNKINILVDSVNKTADEYFETVEFVRAFNVISSASVSAVRSIKSAVKDSVVPLALIDALIFVVYLGIAVAVSVVSELKKKSTGDFSEKQEKSEEEVAVSEEQ